MTTKITTEIAYKELYDRVTYLQNIHSEMSEICFYLASLLVLLYLTLHVFAYAKHDASKVTKTLAIDMSAVALHSFAMFLVCIEFLHIFRGYFDFILPFEQKFAFMCGCFFIFCVNIKKMLSYFKAPYSILRQSLLKKHSVLKDRENPDE